MTTPSTATPPDAPPSSTSTTTTANTSTSTPTKQAPKANKLSKATPKASSSSATDSTPKAGNSASDKASSSSASDSTPKASSSTSDSTPKVSSSVPKVSSPASDSTPKASTFPQASGSPIDHLASAKKALASSQLSYAKVAMQLHNTRKMIQNSIQHTLKSQAKSALAKSEAPAKPGMAAIPMAKPVNTSISSAATIARVVSAVRSGTGSSAGGISSSASSPVVTVKKIESPTVGQVIATPISVAKMVVPPAKPLHATVKGITTIAGSGGSVSPGGQVTISSLVNSPPGTLKETLAGGTPLSTNSAGNTGLSASASTPVLPSQKSPKPLSTSKVCVQYISLLFTVQPPNKAHFVTSHYLSFIGRMSSFRCKKLY